MQDGAFVCTDLWTHINKGRIVGGQHAAWCAFVCVLIGRYTFITGRMYSTHGFSPNQTLYLKYQLPHYLTAVKTKGSVQNQTFNSFEENQILMRIL